MSKAVICPVCDGKGTIDYYSTTATIEKICYGCQGKGWIEVGDY